MMTEDTNAFLSVKLPAPLALEVFGDAESAPSENERRIQYFLNLGHLGEAAIGRGRGHPRALDLPTCFAVGALFALPTLRLKFAAQIAEHVRRRAEELLALGDPRSVLEPELRTLRCRLPQSGSELVECELAQAGPRAPSSDSSVLVEFPVDHFIRQKMDELSKALRPILIELPCMPKTITPEEVKRFVDAVTKFRSLTRLGNTIVATGALSKLVEFQR